jgi:2-dehydropantoate 2-reductase
VKPGGALLPIQNGAVSEVLGARLGEVVLGGLSNLGATMVQPGVYEQRNAGHILLGELAGGRSDRADRVVEFLSQGIEARATGNLSGAIWSKLLLNCSVTTIGAIAGVTMREYIARADGRALFDSTYDEALTVALTSGVRPERMLVDPVPPHDRDAWLGAILAAYGDLRPSMLQDFERRRPTEIEFINGYVAERGRALGVATKFNARITSVVRTISRGDRAPALENLGQILHG